MFVVWIACVIVIVPAAPAYAYLDAGTGSMLLQMLLAGLAGVGVLFKMYWRRIKRLFVRGTVTEARNSPATTRDAPDDDSIPRHRD